MNRFLALVAALFLMACAQGGPLLREQPVQIPSGASVVIMPADVEISLMSASGILEPKAEWTATAVTNLSQALEGFLRGKGARAVAYRAPADDAAAELAHLQLRKLQDTVAIVILQYVYGGRLPSTDRDTSGASTRLPTLKRHLDWSIGKQARALGESQSADFALFVFARDGFSSGTRAGTSIFAAAVGVYLARPVQAAYASLVDLRTGEVVWFNRTIQIRSPILNNADLRAVPGANEAVQRLLRRFPL